MPKWTLYMLSYTYPIKGLSSQSIIRNKRISGDIRFTTIKQSFQNLLSKMIETATLLLLSLEYLESTKNLLVTKACKSCLWSWKLLNAMNVVAKRVASGRRILAYPSLFLNQFNKETWLYTKIVTFDARLISSTTWSILPTSLKIKLRQWAAHGDQLMCLFLWEINIFTTT